LIKKSKSENTYFHIPARVFLQILHEHIEIRGQTVDIVVELFFLNELAERALTLFDLAENNIER
jgi:hypothetical protein